MCVERPSSTTNSNINQQVNRWSLCHRRVARRRRLSRDVAPAGPIKDETSLRVMTKRTTGRPVAGSFPGADLWRAGRMASWSLYQECGLWVVASCFARRRQLLCSSVTIWCIPRAHLYATSSNSKHRQTASSVAAAFPCVSCESCCRRDESAAEKKMSPSAKGPPVCIAARNRVIALAFWLVVHTCCIGRGKEQPLLAPPSVPVSYK